MKALSITVLAIVMSTSALHASDCTESYRTCMNVCADKIGADRCMLSCHIARKFCSGPEGRGTSARRQFDASENPAPLRKEMTGRLSHRE